MQQNRNPYPIRILSHCPLCQTDFKVSNPSVIEERVNAKLIYITCAQCRGALVALVYIDAHGSNSVGVVTDLAISEVLPFRDADAISIDDVLFVHESLHSR